MILTCVESKDTKKIKLQSVDIHGLNLEQVNKADIFYWEISLISNNRCKDNIKLSESGEFYIKQSFLNQYQESLSEGIYYTTKIINEDQINKMFNYDIIFSIDEENELTKISEISDYKNKFIVFRPDYKITEEINKEQKEHIKEVKKIERIRNCFYKVLSREETQLKLVNRGKIIEQEKLKEIKDSIKYTENSQDLYYSSRFEHQLEKILDEYGIGIKSLSFNMHMINPSLFPIYSKDMSKYLIYHKFIEQNSHPRLYLDYCRYLSNIINQSCKFKLGLYNLDNQENEVLYINQINKINFYLHNKFSILDLMI